MLAIRQGARMLLPRLAETRQRLTPTRPDPPDVMVHRQPGRDHEAQALGHHLDRTEHVAADAADLAVASVPMPR